MAERPKAPKHTYWRSGVLWARFSVGGREYRESLRTSDVKVARARVGKMRDRAIGASAFGEDRKTWEQAVIEWTAHIEKEVSATTALRYSVSLAQIRPYLTGKFIDEICKADVLHIKKMRGKTVTNATIRRDLQALSSVLAFAELNDWRIGNPARLIMENTSERRDPIVLPTEGDFTHMRGRLSASMEALMLAARATGARISELTNVKRADLNVKARTLTVIGKRNKRRTLEISADTAETLGKLPAALNTKNLFHFDGESISGASGLFSKATKAARLAAQKEKRDFTGFRFHDLRHWFAVEWLRAGRSIYDLQQHLGHSTIATTEMYLEFLTVEEQEIVKRPAEKALDDMRIKSA